MTEVLTVYQFIGIIISLVGVVTGSSIFYMRKNAERIESSNSNIFVAMKESHKELKKDVKDLSIHLDERIERMYGRLDMNTAELKEYVSKEVIELKSKDHDQEVKIENSRDKINTVSEELLKFKIEVSEKYERKTL